MSHSLTNSFMIAKNEEEWISVLLILDRYVEGVYKRFSCVDSSYDKYYPRYIRVGSSLLNSFVNWGGEAKIARFCTDHKEIPLPYFLNTF